MHALNMRGERPMANSKVNHLWPFAMAVGCCSCCLPAAVYHYHTKQQLQKLFTPPAPRTRSHTRGFLPLTVTDTPSLAALGEVNVTGRSTLLSYSPAPLTLLVLELSDSLALHITFTPEAAWSCSCSSCSSFFLLIQEVNRPALCSIYLLTVSIFCAYFDVLVILGNANGTS